MVPVKHEVIDLEYEEQEMWRKKEEDEDALMIARKIKEEFIDESSPSPSRSPPHRTPNQIIQENIRAELAERRPPPIVFDHFICMRIGLNSRNNVQQLMALLTAHEFFDLTVLPSPSIIPAPMPPPPLIQMGVPRLLPPCPQEPTTSNGLRQNIELDEQKSKQPPKIKRTIVKKLPTRTIIKAPATADCGIIPINMRCRKCDEIIPKGSHGSIALNHVQKIHMKMSAFQCRICKHYRTTQERIQSHVTTVHKAKSATFDSSLAGPLSAEDIRKMEEMITACFPPLKMELQVTDRLIAKTMEVDLSQKRC